MKTLIATNHLVAFTGSEIVALELAEAFQSKGHECLLLANVVSKALAEHADTRNVTVQWKELLPRLEDFDVVWCFHHVLPLLLEDRPPRPEQGFPLIISAHLSPYEPFEAPSPLVEELFAAKILANSLETREALARSIPERSDVGLFPNPAPGGFFQSRNALPEKLSNLLVISNHLPPELTEALRLIGARTDVCVRHIGLGGERKRVMPEDILAADALVTIGKSVQYGLVSQTPVFCYDVFGGPGWLGEDNLARAEHYNFSGRCTPGRRSGQQLAEELLGGFGPVAQFASRLHHRDLHRFSLDAYIIDVLDAAAVRKPWEPVRAATMTERYPELLRVRNLARLLRREASHKWRLLEEYARLRDRAEALSQDGGRSLPALEEELFSPLAWFRNPETPAPQAVPAAEQRIGQELWNEMAGLPQVAGGGRIAEQAAARWMAETGASILVGLGDMPHREISPLSTSTLSWDGGSPSITSDTNDPGLLVSFDPGPDALELGLFVGVMVPPAEGGGMTDLQVFYRGPGQEHFDEAHSHRKPVTPGYNFLYFVLGPASLEGCLRIDPGDRPGTYQFSSLSIFRMGASEDRPPVAHRYISDEPDFRHLADRERYREL